MTVRMTLRLEDAVVRWLKDEAKTRGVSMSRIIREAMEEAMREQHTPAEKHPVDQLFGVLHGKLPSGDALALVGDFRGPRPDQRRTPPRRSGRRKQAGR